MNRSLTRIVENPSIPRQFWHLCLMIYFGARRVHLARMAAALSYRTIFGIIPVIVVGISVYANFAPNHAGQAVRDLLKFTNLNQIEEQDAPTPMAPAMPDDEVVVSPLSPHATPDAGNTAEAAVPTPQLSKAEKIKLDKWIEELVNRAKSVQFGAISIVGLLTLFYAAISMLVEIEKTFNHIFMAPSGRSWTRRIPLYWTLLTLGNVGLIASFGVQGKILSMVSSSEFLQSSGAGDGALAVIGYLFTVLISAVVLFVMYATVPNTRVKPSAAIVGAVIGAVLWEAGKWGFAQYLKYSFGYAKLYGSIAILPLFLLWVYATWMIILLGLQIAQAIQTYSMAKSDGLTQTVLATLGLVAEAPKRLKNPIIDSSAILTVMAAVSERFIRGKSTDHSAIADATGIDERIVAEMLERLAGEGFLHRLASGDQEGTYTLAKPPDQILAAEVLLVGDTLAGIDRRRATGVLDELVMARSAVLRGKTIADITKGWKPHRGKADTAETVATEGTELKRATT
jgi:membrane protein